MEESDPIDEWYADFKDTKELRNVLYGFEKESWNYLNMMEWLKDEMEKALKCKESWNEDIKSIPIKPNNEERANELAIPSVINLLKFFQFQPPDTNKSEHQQYWTIPKEYFDEDPSSPTGKPIIWSKCFFLTEILDEYYENMDDLISDFETEDEDITSRVGNAPVRKKLINITKCKNCMKTYKSLMQHLNKESKCKLTYSDLDLSDLKEKVKANSEEKARERKKIQYQNNRDEILKVRKLYHKENAEKISKKQMEYKQRNYDKVLQQKSDYYQRHKEKITEKRKIKEKETIQNEKQKCHICGKLCSQAGDLNDHIYWIHRRPTLMEQKKTSKSIDSTKLDSEEGNSVEVGPSLIRKRKPIDFTMDDLEADKEEENDLDFKIDNTNKN